MHRVLIVGGGKIGRTVTRLLLGTRDYYVRVLDVDARALQSIPDHPRLERVVGDATDPKALADAMRDRDTVVAASGNHLGLVVAEAALASELSYFDLGEDVHTARVLRALGSSVGRNRVMMPQCGLAPGFVSLLGHALARRLDTVESLSLRVGALPLYPNNALKFALTGSTEGLIHAYCNPCEVLSGGQLVEVPPLEGLEEITLEGVRYEAFHTSGGVGTLADSLVSRVRELDFKSLRYPGHRERMQFLLRDMRLASRRELLAELLSQAVPTTTQDVVLVLCEARGMRDGSYVQLSDSRRIHGRRIEGEDLSALQLTTSASLAAMLDLHVAGLLPRGRVVRQEEVDLEVFLGGRFGRYFEPVRPLPLPEAGTSSGLRRAARR